MALRFANKIHCIVNNVVAQGLRLQAHALKASAPPPKTRYPLNQQDANTYIEQLKARAFVRQAVDANEPDVVRTFNVDVHCRTAPKQQEPLQPAGATFGLAQRFLATKAGKDGKPFAKTSLCSGGKKKKPKVECKKGPAANAEKCPKLAQDDGCPKFKIENCEKAKDPNCNTRPFIFVDCQKMPAPYPSFSEACYEPLPPSVNECKDCPWSADYNHPTFKGPMNKFNERKGASKGAKGQKRKFHMDARRFVTLRFGESRKTEKEEREQDLQKRLYDELNKSVFEAKHERARRLPMDDSVQVCPVRSSLAADYYRRLLHLKLIADRPAAINAHRWEMLLKGPGWRHQLGNPRLHKLRRKVANDPCDRCPRFNYKYKYYDIKAKQRKYRKAMRKEKARQKKECECSSSEVPTVSMVLAPKGRNMDQHMDMPHHKPHRHGNRRHRLRDRTQYPECISNTCDVLPFKPPMEYDMEEKKNKKKKKNKGKCGCELINYDNPLAMWCKRQPRKPKKDDTSLECDELVPSEICPKNLLDRKPYPKYRKAAKKRLAKEAELEKKRQADKYAKKLAKKRMNKKPPQTCGGLGVEEAVGFMQNRPYAIRPHNVYRKRLAELYLMQPRGVAPSMQKQVPKFDFKPLPDDQCGPPVSFRTEEAEERAQFERIDNERHRIRETLARLENMIMAKNRIRVTGPPQCTKVGCEDGGMIEKKKCPKKIKSKVCPTDLLDRKPYKKYRDAMKKKGKKGKKGKHGKHGKHHASGAKVDEKYSMLHLMTARAPNDQPYV